MVGRRKIKLTPTPSPTPEDQHTLLIHEVQKLLPELRRIAANSDRLEKIEAKLEMALSPSGYAKSLFDAIYYLQFTLEQIGIAVVDNVVPEGALTKTVMPKGEISKLIEDSLPQYPTKPKTEESEKKD